MNQPFTCLLVAALAIGTASYTAPSPAPSRDPDSNVEILVDGRPLTRYAHAGRPPSRENSRAASARSRRSSPTGPRRAEADSYVEAVKGREYSIRLRNPYGVRAAVALSVDGLNTIDAPQTTVAAARKWVLDPYETITISGWQTSKTEARRFEFTIEERSYAQALGKTANLGVISAVFFKERPIAIMTESSKDRGRRGAVPVPRSAPAEPQASAAAGESPKADEYAATGMGRRTDHAVTQVWLDLEDMPAQTVNIRYEFRPQLVKLGILPPHLVDDPLQRRERARGFEPGFCPEPPRPR